MTPQSLEVLRASLEMAVPLWIEELKGLPYEMVLDRMRWCGQVVAEKGDVIQFPSKKKGETAHAFSRLAEGLAALSFAPGGVTFLGLHFEAKHPGGPK